MEVLLRAQCWQSRRQLVVSGHFFPHKSSRDQLFGGQCARVGDTVQGLENNLRVFYWPIASPHKTIGLLPSAADSSVHQERSKLEKCSLLLVNQGPVSRQRQLLTKYLPGTLLHCQTDVPLSQDHLMKKK
jgi:hypothetical protein